MRGVEGFRFGVEKTCEGSSILKISISGVEKTGGGSKDSVSVPGVSWHSKYRRWQVSWYEEKERKRNAREQRASRFAPARSTKLMAVGSVG